jgi:spore coat protein JB
LRTRNNETIDWQGDLPSPAPLANPYVPFQRRNPQRYDAPKGWVRGTLFPGLDLPFKGMVNQLRDGMGIRDELQIYTFAVNDLALYLDTHREDAEALELYRAYQAKRQRAAEEYANRCRPLNHQMITEGGYHWLDDPWPWEYAANREG